MNWVDADSLDIDAILKVLPHRYPFLMVDKVLEIKTGGPIKIGMPEAELQKNRIGSFARALKNVTYNETQFQGHFPEKPVLPGVLTIEAMAQTAVFAIVPYLAASNQGNLPRLLMLLAGTDEMRFRRPIRPGDQLQMRVVVGNVRGPLWSFDCETLVDGKKAADGKILAHLDVAPTISQGLP